MFKNFFSSQKTAKVRIVYGKLIDPIFIFYCKNNPALKERGWNNWEPPTQEKIQADVKRYKETWKIHEEKVIQAMTKVLNLQFRALPVNAYIVSGNPQQISSPLIIKVGYKSDNFVAVLIHELIHVLLEQNATRIKKNYADLLTEEETSKTTKNHIVVFATMTYLYKTILGQPSYLEVLKKIASDHSTDEYTLAWRIVEKKGYLNLLKNFRENCQK